MGHHYAIWASDSNVLLAQKKFQALYAYQGFGNVTSL